MQSCGLFRRRMPHRSSLRIGVNCLDVYPSFVGGVTTYVLGLLEGLAEVEKGMRFRLYFSRENAHLFERFKSHDNFDFVVAGNFYRFAKLACNATLLAHSAWVYECVSNVLFRALRKRLDRECDLILNPTPTLHYFNARRPVLLCMHDIQHLHYPEFFPWHRRLSRNIKYALSARWAHYFQANSEYTKADMLEHFPWLSPDQVEVIASGALLGRFELPADVDVIAKYKLPQRFLFYPAQLWPHKNHLTLLKALKHLETTSNLQVPLVLTGEQFGASEQVFGFIRDNQMDHVYYLGKVPFADLVGLYQSATFLVTTTLHESSSLPIFEAAAAGTPVMASRIPPIEEIVRTLRLNYFDPLDPVDIATSIRALWMDDAKRRSQSEYNRDAVRCFSWTNTAQGIAKLFLRIGLSSPERMGAASTERTARGVVAS